MAEEKSLYELIEESLTEDGTLPADFDLPDENGEGEMTIAGAPVRFAAGAKDGIFFYHMGPRDIKELEEWRLLKEALQLASDEKLMEACGKVYTFAEIGNALSCADSIQEYIIENKDKLNLGNIYKLGFVLALNSNKVEVVKVGMVILELFPLGEEEKEVIRILGRSDEFTLFSAFILSRGDNAEAELFDLAKHVKGWGRVHAVRMIPNTSPEVEEWLLLNGVNNEVVPAYSGLDVFEKIDFMGWLKKEDLDLVHYRALADVMEAMLDEGPVMGISVVENKNEVIKAFLDATAKRGDLEEEDFCTLEILQEYLFDEEETENEKLRKLAEEILSGKKA